MLSHVSVGTNAFEPAFGFYEALFAELGHKLRFCDREKPWAAWQQQAGGRPLFILSAPFDGEAASAGNGQMIALLAGDRSIAAIPPRWRAADAARARPACGSTTIPTIMAPIFAIRMATSFVSAATRRNSGGGERRSNRGARREPRRLLRQGSQ